MASRSRTWIRTSGLYESLQPLDDLAAAHGVVLTPHNSRPIPEDDRYPSQVDIMIAGIYNLGFVSLAPRPEVERLLDWWSQRLLRDCRVDPVWGYFVDQRWFDLAPGFLEDFAIARDPQYNLAYWNLHQHRLEQVDGGYLVDGQPLCFFHFSGFDPDRPLVLSRHQNRIDVLAEPALEQLLAGYATELIAAGHLSSRKWPYSYARLGDGSDVDDVLRDLYDEYVDEQPAEVRSPFELQGARDFKRWSQSQAPGAPAGINRVLYRLYESRPDLQAAYSGRHGPDTAGLQSWARDHGPSEEPFLAQLMTVSDDQQRTDGELGQAPPRAVRRSRRSTDPITDAAMVPRAPREPALGPLRQEPWGVNVVGYFRSELGTGEAARQVVGALDARRIPVMPIHGQMVPLSRQEHAYQTATPEDAPFPLNLICVNADMLPEFVREVGQDFFAERYSIGLWFWEVSRFPDRWRGSFSLLEEVWAPTAHIAAALEPLADVPVHTVRVPIVPNLHEQRSRAELGIDPDKFVFLFSFDYLSVAERKNPLATVEAFRRAFEPGDGAALVLKCINQEHNPRYHSELREAVAAHPDITLIDRYLSPADNSGLSSVCDSYVSLHRAEGLGLGMAEAMWHGKPVIATGYSGNLDFMNASNSLLVDHELVEIGPDASPYPADGVWAQPDVDHAAKLMRGLFDDRDAASALGRTAASEIRRTHSPQAAGEIMQLRLEAIRATGKVRPTHRSLRLQSPSLAALPLRLRQGPEGAGTPAGSARGTLRKAILRVMRPFTSYQQAFNADVTSAMKELSSGLGDARKEVGVELAQVLAELRNASELRGVMHEQERRIEALERALGAKRAQAGDGEAGDAGDAGGG